MAVEMKDFVGESMKQFTDMCGASLRTGMKMQEESARAWNDMMNRTTSDCRANFDRMADEVLPMGRKNVERMSKLMDDQAQRGMDLLKQAFDMPSNVAECGTKMIDMWRNSMEMARCSADAATKANVELMNGWTEFVRGACCTPLGGKPAPKAAAK